MRDELAAKTIENSFQIKRSHPIIQQRPTKLVKQDLGVPQLLKKRYNTFQTSSQSFAVVEV
ncbi:MAG: hypothetical protein V7L29_05145 [Nostoc sp.]|uniref:hypothetical protein n=1 Tax=Nostoc sp. TaxID=1180 RepID=UPI002FFC27E8